MVVKFPTDCHNCEYIEYWESGIAEITCHCECHGVTCDADEHIHLYCEEFEERKVDDGGKQSKPK